LSGRATRDNRNPRRLGEFALARVFAARSADSAKRSVNFRRGGRSHDTSAVCHASQHHRVEREKHMNEKMKIVVIGDTGLIGTKLVNNLGARGLRIGELTFASVCGNRMLS